ncbi:MAG: hypothetical protein WC462_03970 [archaeon]
MNKSCRGQVSMEFIVSVILLFAIFIFGLMIFQSRNELNNVSSERWLAQETAYRVARNINNAYLLDNNSVIRDVIYWNDSGDSIVLGRKSVQVVFNDNFADASLVTGNVDLRVTDFNGLIYFKKINGRIVVDYS